MKILLCVLSETNGAFTPEGAGDQTWEQYWISDTTGLKGGKY